MVLHLFRGEAAALPLNVILLALSAFILWAAARERRSCRVDDGRSGTTLRLMANADITIVQRRRECLM
ncbi:hypothetical protein QA644_34120 (plasmid) [Rhizobium sp. CC1099]|uniref:hypothetical protein n=1 Tax=Rhizobium sp. CC1099 TaxID=3039160 RepID=UPI0024B0E32C|nr:hypothetical protein [Rhizobium sp. CC1099]WFU92225.1 hypothetical protein QA644_34120 [Rhizobium sp. CC1099]